MGETEKEIEEGKVLAVIGYLWILFLLPLLLQRQNRFAQFHGKQGLVLFVFWFLVWLVLFVILGHIPFVGIIFQILGYIGYIAYVILAIIGLIKAASGEYWRLPVLGAYAERIKF
jgi:uncharacterized membrane protein